VVVTPTVESVHAAAARTRGLVGETPLIRFSALEERLGREVLVKVETLQHTGSFKFRGAMAKLTSLSPEVAAAGVVAYSTGNHGLAVAEAGRRLGIGVTVVVPDDAPEVKVKRMAASGAALVRCDRFKADGEAIALALADHRGQAFVHPFNDPVVIAGQGTLTLELARQAEALGGPPDLVLVNSAGGGFVAGTILAGRAALPDAQIWSVEAEGWDAIRRTRETGVPADNLAAPRSICDAIQARRPGPVGQAIIADGLHGALAVSDDQAIDALRYAFARLRLVVEPGGVVGLAALLAGKVPDRFKRVAVILCGGNVDAERYAGWVAEADVSGE